MIPFALNWKHLGHEKHKWQQISREKRNIHSLPRIKNEATKHFTSSSEKGTFPLLRTRNIDQKTRMKIKLKQAHQIHCIWWCTVLSHIILSAVPYWEWVGGHQGWGFPPGPGTGCCHSRGSSAALARICTAKPGRIWGGVSLTRRG